MHRGESCIAEIMHREKSCIASLEFMHDEKISCLVKFICRENALYLVGINASREDSYLAGIYVLREDIHAPQEDIHG